MSADTFMIESRKKRMVPENALIEAPEAKHQRKWNALDPPPAKDSPFRNLLNPSESPSRKRDRQYLSDHPPPPPNSHPLPSSSSQLNDPSDAFPMVHFPTNTATPTATTIAATTLDGMPRSDFSRLYPIQGDSFNAHSFLHDVLGLKLHRHSFLQYLSKHPNLLSDDLNSFSDSSSSSSSSSPSSSSSSSSFTALPSSLEERLQEFSTQFPSFQSIAVSHPKCFFGLNSGTLVRPLVFAQTGHSVRFLGRLLLRRQQLRLSLLTMQIPAWDTELFCTDLPIVFTQDQIQSEFSMEPRFSLKQPFCRYQYHSSDFTLSHLN